MKRENLKWQLPILLVLIVGTVYILRRQSQMPYQKDTGKIFGTIFHATYQSDKNYFEDIMAELKKVDNSLSPFNPNSVISRINRNEDVEPDPLFMETYYCAQEISKKTSGAFDFTIAPLANAWGFGFKQGIYLDSQAVDSLREIVDYRKVSFANNRIVKEDDRIMLSGSAIAKGFASDIIGRLLEKKGVRNYMVEIGGEIVVKGKNPQKKLWRIAVNKPVEDSLSINQDIKAVLELTDIGMATSGNYRNFHYRDGKKYGHTIDPRTGYPVQTEILSATVLADNCMTADGYATAFMVMGFEKTKELVENTPGLEVYLIYLDAAGNEETYMSPSMKRYVVEENII